MATLSLVVPVYNEQEAIPLFFEALEQVKTKIENFNFEYWFIDDGSTDNTIQTIKELNIKYDYVHFIEFSRNFGKEASNRRFTISINPTSTDSIIFS